MNLWILGSEGHRNSGVFKYSESLSKGLSSRGHSIDEMIFLERFFHIKKYVFLPLILLRHSLFKKYDRIILPDESYAFLFLFLFGFNERCIIIHDYRRPSSKNLRELVKSVIMRVNYRLFGMFDKIICVSDFTKKEILKELAFINGEKACVIHNSIDFPPLSVVGKESKEKEYFDFIYVGSHESRKNTLKILDAFSLFESECISDNVRLLILGRPIDSKIYTEFKEKASCLKNVICYGEVDEAFLIDVLASSSCFVCASDFEGFGRTPVEAQYFGVPVISTSLAALGEILPSETKVEITAPVSSQSILDAMKTCYNLTEQERSDLVKNAKVNVERFKLDTLVQKFEVSVFNEKNTSYNS